MALTIEDGTGVEGADSYASVEYTQAYAAKRGLSLPATNAAIEVLLTKAMDCIEALRDSMQGSKTVDDQACQYPRTGVVIDGVELDSNTIPKELPAAQAQLACDEYASPGSLQPNSDGREIVRERVEGAIETEWARTGDSNPQPQHTAAMALLAPLLRNSGSSGIAVRA